MVDRTGVLYAQCPCHASRAPARADTSTLNIGYIRICQTTIPVRILNERAVTADLRVRTHSGIRTETEDKRASEPYR